MLKRLFFNRRYFLLASVILLSLVGTASAQFEAKLLPPRRSEVGIQGRLTDMGRNANGNRDFKVCVCDDDNCPNPPMACMEKTGVPVIDGIFDFALDFGTVIWDGDKRTLQFSVRRDATESYVVLAPTQTVNNTPYAIQSMSSSAADALSAKCDTVDCVKDQYIESVSGGKITGQIPGGSLPTNSNSYIQNQNSTMQVGDFDISGTGSANIFDAQSEFRINGDRVLSLGASGNANTFAGRGAGGTINTGNFNSFFGFGSGSGNTSGGNNSFFGSSSGATNITGSRNSFFGGATGFFNTAGNDNSFFGSNSGNNNDANNNSFFGSSSGQSNTSGSGNSFFGWLSGRNSTTGSRNSFFGISSGLNNLSGVDNSFFGNDAGRGDVTNGSGALNSFFGSDAGERTTANANSFFGYQSGNQNTTGSQNSFLGANSGQNNTTGIGNTFIGSGAGNQNVSGNFNTTIGFGANVGNSNTTNNNTAVGFNSSATGGGATAIGVNATATVPNTIVLGTATNTVLVPGSMNVSGTLSKGGGSFKIDHPLDPKNKFLYHSFVESPDMMNVYNGNVTTDENGEAVVQMPDYFEALNRDFRYQLTVIGQFSQAIIAEKIKDNSFKIKTDKPNIEVSWQITGIRQDPFAEQNRIKVEVEKSEMEKGSFLYPELYKKQKEEKKKGNKNEDKK